MKIVINKCFGGFSVSKKAVEFMAEKGSEQAKAELEYIIPSEDNSDCYYGYSEKFNHEYDRTDPILVEAVEVLKDKANGRFAKLKVIEIPEGVEWEITDNDGLETVHEKHRMWS
jgi:hypothetical protein